MRVGIVGLPNAGKSSLFNILTGANAQVDVYPFTTIERNIGVVSVPDERLAGIGRIVSPKKLTPAHIDFVDIAGLVKGASHGEGLGNRFLSHIRETDLLLHLVRDFPDSNVPHVLETLDPDRDLAIVETELALADLDTVEGRLEHVRKESHSTERDVLLSGLEKLKSSLDTGFSPPLLHEDELRAVRDLNLFVLKPRLHAINCSDTLPTQPSRYPRLSSLRPVCFSTTLEAAIQNMTALERSELRVGLNVDPDGPTALVRRCFEALNLLSFYTIKGDEARSWAAPRGTTALEAASMIHTDIARGFIKAEVVSYSELNTAGDYRFAQQSGKVRIEGKNYVLQDGDILLIKFRI